MKQARISTENDKTSKLYLFSPFVRNFVKFSGEFIDPIVQNLQQRRYCFPKGLFGGIKAVL